MNTVQAEEESHWNVPTVWAASFEEAALIFSTIVVSVNNTRGGKYDENRHSNCTGN